MIASITLYCSGVMTAPEALHAAAERVATAARDLAKLADAAGEAKAHFVHAQALARLGKVGACEAALDQALAAARRAGDRRRANAVLAGAPLAALWGPSPVTRASGRCLDVVRVLRITHGAPAVEAVALRCQAVLEALRGRSEAARRMIASSRRMVEELGIMHRVLEADMFAGLIELLENDPASAERSLRTAYTGLRDHGLAIDAAQAAALLGRALLALDRASDAEAISRESETLAGDDLQAAIAWRGVRAEALARRGEHAAAVDLARAAVEIAAATDALLVHADARLALATALRTLAAANVRLPGGETVDFLFPVWKRDEEKDGGAFVNLTGFANDDFTMTGRFGFSKQILFRGVEARKSLALVGGIGTSNIGTAEVEDIEVDVIVGFFFGCLEIGRHGCCIFAPKNFIVGENLGIRNPGIKIVVDDFSGQKGPLREVGGYGSLKCALEADNGIYKENKQRNERDKKRPEYNTSL